MYEEEEQSPLNIIPALIKYKWHLAVAIPIIMIIAITVALAIPPVYRSTAYVMVETQQIPSSLVQSTVTNAASEQIEIITQRVMTREKLASILRAHSYFGFNEADPLQKNRILRNFRDNIQIEVTRVQSGRERVAIGFTISFDSESPAVAQAIADKLTKLFLGENIKARTERASETTEFLESEAEKMRVQLEKTESQVAAFKNKYKDSLPEHLNLYVGMREDTRQTLNSLNESISDTKNQIISLKNQLNLSKETGSVVGTGKENELANLRREYSQLLLQYQPDHPDVVLLKDKIDSLEGKTSNSSSSSGSSVFQQEIETQISALNNKLARLNDEKATVANKLADLEERIIRIPQVEREFTAIKRNYDAIQEQYQSLQGKAQSAAMAESLEQEQKAERFSLLEPPYVPTSPYKPNRELLLAIAFLGSIGLPLSIVFAIGFLDKSIHSSDSLTQVIGSPPLVEIPNLKTADEILRQRKILMLGIASAGCIFFIILLIVHFSVMPLNVFLSKVFTRVGI